MGARLSRTAARFFNRWPYLLLLAVYKLLEDRFLADINGWADSNTGVLDVALGPFLDYWPGITGWGLIPLVIVGIVAHSYFNTRPRDQAFEGAFKELAKTEVDSMRWVTGGGRDWQAGLYVAPQCLQHHVRLLYENGNKEPRIAYPYDLIWDEEGFRLVCADGPHFVSLGERPKKLEDSWERAKALLERELTDMSA